jgi:hypothetical protein
MTGIRMYAARSHLAESFIALRASERKTSMSELKRAAAWWPLLPLLPAFYPYAARVILRLALGESLYARLPRRRASAGGQRCMNDAHSEFVEVYRAENGVEAHLFKAALEAAGISTLVTGESVAAMEPNLYWAAPRILVAPDRAEEAARVLRELIEKRPMRPRAGNAG